MPLRREREVVSDPFRLERARRRPDPPGELLSGRSHLKWGELLYISGGISPWTTLLFPEAYQRTSPPRSCFISAHRLATVRKVGISKTLFMPQGHNNVLAIFRRCPDAESRPRSSTGFRLYFFVPLGTYGIPCYVGAFRMLASQATTECMLASQAATSPSLQKADCSIALCHVCAEISHCASYV